MINSEEKELAELNGVLKAYLQGFLEEKQILPKSFDLEEMFELVAADKNLARQFIYYFGEVATKLIYGRFKILRISVNGSK